MGKKDTETPAGACLPVMKKEKKHFVQTPINRLNKKTIKNTSGKNLSEAL